MPQSTMPVTCFAASAAAVLRAALRPARYLIWLLAAAIATASLAVADAPLAASDFKMAGNATEMRVVLKFDREPNPQMVPAARPAPAGHRPGRNRLLAGTQVAQGARPDQERALRRTERRHLTPDPDGQGAVRRRQGRRDRRRKGRGLPSRRRPFRVVRPQVRPGACRAGRRRPARPRRRGKATGSASRRPIPPSASRW